MNQSVKAYRETAIRAAREAGRIIMRNLGGRMRVGFKGKFNLVTRTDHEAEKTVVRLIRRRHPDHGIVAEEGHGLRERRQIQWYVDPLDGTTNYAHGFPSFCVSIGLEISGEMVLGVVFDPFHRELFEARKGKGAFLNGRRISVSRTARLGRSLVVTGFNWKSLPENLRHFARFSMKVEGVRRTGSAALDLCYVAMGRFDGFWELMLSPWDVAAGAVVVREAGGRLSDFSGKHFSVYSREILASNGRVHAQMLSLLRARARTRSG